MLPNILVIVVVYGQEPLKTTSVRTLMATKNCRDHVRLLVWDNSPESHGMEMLHPEWIDRSVYVSTSENRSLSMIYNQVVSDYLKNDEFLLILDQDTYLPENVFNVFEQALSENPDIDLFLPMVHAHGNWVSPAHYFLGWGRYWTGKKTGKQRSRATAAINSGMIISAAYLKEKSMPPYDEKLRFYGTDTQFMVDYAKQRRFLCILNLRIDHDLSFFGSTTVARIEKFLQMKDAHLYIHSRSGLLEMLGAKLVLGLISVIYAARYRSLRCLA